MKKLILLFIPVILTGCATKQRCERKYPVQQMIIYRDSIITTTKTIYRDTTIYYEVKADTVTDTVRIIVKDGIVTFRPSILTTDFAKSVAQVKNNRLQHTLTQNDTLLQLKLDNAIRETWESAERYFSKTETKIVKQKYVPTIFYILSAIGIFYIFVIVFKIVRFFR